MNKYYLKKCKRILIKAEKGGMIPKEISDILYSHSKYAEAMDQLEAEKKIIVFRAWSNERVLVYITPKLYR